MRAQHVEEKIWNWIELNEADKERVLLHCTACETCKDLLEEVQHYALQIETIQRAEFASDNQAQAVQKIMEAINNSDKQVDKNFSFLSRWFLFPFQVAAMLLVLFAGQELFSIEANENSQIPKQATASVLNTSALLKSNLKNRKEKPISIRKLIEKKLKK
jgi:hypothetical protein